MAAQTSVPDKFPVKIFETDVAQVSAGTPQGGWVSGTPNALAASASVTSIFDLGQDWHQFGTVTISVNPVGPSTGFSSVQATSSDTAASNAARRLNYANAANSAAIGVAINTSNGNAAFNVKPMGRYLTVLMTNADATNAMGAAKVTIAAYPN